MIYAKVNALLLALLLTACKNDAPPTTAYSGHIAPEALVYGPYVVVKLPVTKGVPIANPIQLALGPGNLLYACNQTGEVYTLRDTDGDGLEDTAELYCHVGDHGLHSPAGLTHRGDTVYVGTREQIRAYLDRDHDGKADTSWTFFDRVPQSAHPYEWTAGLAFGADGWLYAALTTDSWNAAPSVDPNGYRGSIIRIAPDGRRAERVATGIRSVPGMTFTDRWDLLFLDNAGGGNPTEELNLLAPGRFYGHNKKKYMPDTIVEKPAFDLTFELAPSSLLFNPLSNDFGGTGGQLFVSYYGPGERWNRGALSRVVITRNADGQYTFAEHAVADLPKISDIAFGPDGSLYAAHHGMADYWYNAVYPKQGHFYKVIHDPSVRPERTTREKPEKTFSAYGVEAGKQLYAELSCLGCHQVDGTTELLGPNLKEAARNFSRDEILDEIRNPSARIKPSMIGLQVEKRDGTVQLGRVVNAGEDEISMMLIGNQVVTVKRKDIWKQEEITKSLMYENLIKGLPDEKVNQLLDYIMSLGQ